MFKSALFASALLVGSMMATGSAMAAPTQTDFTAAGIGLISNWTSVALGAGGTFGSAGNGSLTGNGTAVLELRDGDYPNSFGYSNNDGSHSGKTTIFGTGAAQESVVAYLPPALVDFVFWFRSNPSGDSEDAYIFTDGVIEEADGSNNEVNLYLFRNNADSNYWAFFFDDGGPGGICSGFNACDDNDDNDMVVTVRQTAVPEPMTLGLLGAGLLGLGAAARRRRAA